jgi:hypothetical protein
MHGPVSWAESGPFKVEPKSKMATATTRSSLVCHLTIADRTPPRRGSQEEYCIALLNIPWRSHSN